MSPETGPETFLKAQLAVSEVLGRQRFNTAVFWALLLLVRRQPSSSETGERPILWQEQRDFKEDHFVKTVSSFSHISCKSFPMLSCQNPLARRVSSQNNTPNVTLFFSEIT